MVHINNGLWHICKNTVSYFVFNRVKGSFILFIILMISFQSTITGEEPQDYTDTDGDGFPDTIDDDDDDDGFSDIEELDAGTDPKNASDHPKNTPFDTDGDDLPDSEDPDDDNDGLSDVDEKKINSNPRLQDTDRDRLFDNDEVKLGTNPLKKDSDYDNFLDGDEVFAGTDPLNSTDFPEGVISYAGQDQIVYPNECVKLSGKFSIGNITGYSWDFDASDGIQVDSTKEKDEHIYLKGNIYTVTLKVTDGNTTDTDTCLVIVEEDLAARLAIVKNRENNSISYLEDVELSLRYRDNTSVVLEVDGDLSTGAFVVFTMDSYTMMVFEHEEIIIKFDDLIIDQSNLINIIDSKGKSRYPLYNLSRFYDNLQIILYIPHFSEHKITIEKIERTVPGQDSSKEPSQYFIPFWFFIVVGLIIAIIISLGISYSYKKAEDLKFFSKFNIDDETRIGLLNNIENKSINWEEYDSEK